MTTKLQIKGGTGAALIPYLKKIGFVASDGSPTELYKRFRNQATAGSAVASAITLGYKPLEAVNEYFYDLSDKDLLALIVQVTGVEEGNQVAKLTLSTLKTLKGFADFEAKQTASDKVGHDGVVRPAEGRSSQTSKEGRVGLNLAYTINLNLPATSDQAVFNAIFRSLKEHLFTDHE